MVQASLVALKNLDFKIFVWDHRPHQHLTHGTKSKTTKNLAITNKFHMNRLLQITCIGYTDDDNDMMIENDGEDDD